MTQLQPRLGARDIAVAGLMNLLWGMNIIAVKMAVNEIPPLTAALLRQAIVLMVCLSWLRIVPGRMRELLAFGVMTGGLYFLVINLSMAVATNVGALAIAGQLGVPFAMLLAVVILKERIHKYRIAGVAMSLLGVGILVFDPEVAREIPGIALTALASLIWAGSSLIQRNLRGVPVLSMYAWVGLLGVAILAPVALVFEPEGIRSIPHLPLHSLGWVAFSAIGSTIIGHGSMSWLLQRHPVASVTPLTLAAPVLSVVFASLFFHTPLTPLMILGGIVALAGVAIVTIRSARVGENRA
ncbi:EamA family transporter [Sphingomonas sp. MAH-20]|uniref:EamA family transporter n=1 Tax=Sphingomonas horti TaxID=2682842 RepID=A0A6I4IWU4_9SPHN|nr:MULTISPECIES: EamA family transporter [Sphingomonas]MBA2920292.1 EamA family transporter [Sphingomonas sp. CGMCC 1.13658]MVO76546.1 EamA family transporter [Sphingomonas horti]